MWWEISGIVEKEILLSIIGATIIVAFFSLLFVKNVKVKLLLVLLLLSTFFYSGYGIAYWEVNNSYFKDYVLYIVALVLPIVLLFRKKKEKRRAFSYLDRFLLRNTKLLKYATYLYLLCLFIPLIYPEFRLFEMLKIGFRGLTGFYDLRMQYKGSSFIAVIDSLKIFTFPFFMAYIILFPRKKGIRYKSFFLFLLSILFTYMRYGYFSRYQIIMNVLFVYTLLFSIKKFEYRLNVKQILFVGLISILSVPFLYAYIFIRGGNEIEMNYSFLEISKMLIDSEAYYPIFYDHILISQEITSLNPMSYILWLIFLPIPSFLWPNKPIISSDIFTYSVTGLHYGDEGYSSLLPSILGDAYMYFGEHWFMVHALIVGSIIAILLRYLFNHKTMLFYSIYFIIYIMVIGRAGSGSYLPILINGTVPVFLFDIYARSLYKRKLTKLPD